MHTLVIIFAMARTKRSGNRNMVEDIPLEDLSLDDEEDDEEKNSIMFEEKSCRNLSNKK